MTSLPAAAPRQDTGPVVGDGDRRYGQRVRYPMRIVTGEYEDVDTSVYGKVAALAQRGRSTASVRLIAEYAGISKSAAERALGRLTKPGGRDQVTEILVRRRTHAITGTGQTAERWCRPVNALREAWVWAPVLAADTLRPRLHRLYLALRYAEKTRRIPTLAELGELLRHRSGPRARQPLHEGTVSRLLRALEAAGWISVGRRAGYRGRHSITTHDHPIHEPLTPCTDDGSGPDLGDGSLATKEDQGLDDCEKGPAGGPFRRRRETGSRAVDNPGDTPSQGKVRPYSGPELQLSPRVSLVLGPVRHLLPGIRPYLLRRAAREIGRQLDTYATPERLYARLQARSNAVLCADIRDPGAWLLGAALPCHGCGLDDCESGRLWSTGRACEVCADRRTGHPPHPAPPPDSSAPPTSAQGPLIA